MVKAVTRRENLGGEAEFAWEMAQAIDHANTGWTTQLCSLQLKLSKKKFIKLGSYPLEIRKELSNLIRGWIKSSTLWEFEKNRESFSAT